MKTTRTIFTLLMLSTILLSCNISEGQEASIELDFPLEQVQNLPTNEAIEKIAVSDTWIATYSSGKVTAWDVETRKTLWSIALPVRTDNDSEFQIINDILVAAYTDQIFLVNKLGQKSELDLPPEEGGITRLVAIYPSYIYVIRGYDWRLEAYDISQNALLWTTYVGRGGCDVFYDASKNIAYVTTRDKSIHVFDNTTGKVVWERDRSSLHSAFEEGILYTVEHTNDTKMFRFSAFDVESQKELWKKDITPITHVYKLTIIDQLLIASESDGLIALNKSSGDESWRIDTGEPFYTRPVEFNDVIYVKGLSRAVYAISPANGDIIGFVKLEKTRSIQPYYESIADVFKLKDGIVFNTRNAVVIYKTK